MQSQTIAACAHNVDLACHFLDASVTQLETAVADLPRLQRVTNLRRCYQLATEEEVRNAQYQLISEIEPPIRELITRAETGLAQLQKRQRALASNTAPKPPVDLQRKLADLQARRDALSQSNAELELELSATENARPAR